MSGFRQEVSRLAADMRIKVPLTAVKKAIVSSLRCPCGGGYKWAGQGSHPCEREGCPNQLHVAASESSLSKARRPQCHAKKAEEIIKNGNTDIVFAWHKDFEVLSLDIVYSVYVTREGLGMSNITTTHLTDDGRDVRRAGPMVFSGKYLSLDGPQLKRPVLAPAPVQATASVGPPSTASLPSRVTVVRASASGSSRNAASDLVARRRRPAHSADSSEHDERHGDETKPAARSNAKPTGERRPPKISDDERLFSTRFKNTLPQETAADIGVSKRKVVQEAHDGGNGSTRPQHAQKKLKGSESSPAPVGLDKPGLQLNPSSGRSPSLMPEQGKDTISSVVEGRGTSSDPQGREPMDAEEQTEGREATSELDEHDGSFAMDVDIRHPSAELEQHLLEQPIFGDISGAARDGGASQLDHVDTEGLYTDVDDNVAESQNSLFDPQLGQKATGGEERSERRPQEGDDGMQPPPLNMFGRGTDRHHSVEDVSVSGNDEDGLIDADTSSMEGGGAGAFEPSVGTPAAGPGARGAPGTPTAAQVTPLGHTGVLGTPAAQEADDIGASRLRLFPGPEISTASGWCADGMPLPFALVTPVRGGKENPASPVPALGTSSGGAASLPCTDATGDPSFDVDSDGDVDDDESHAPDVEGLRAFCALRMSTSTHDHRTPSDRICIKPGAERREKFLTRMIHKCLGLLGFGAELECLSERQIHVFGKGSRRVQVDLAWRPRDNLLDWTLMENKWFGDYSDAPGQVQKYRTKFAKRFRLKKDNLKLRVGVFVMATEALEVRDMREVREVCTDCGIPDDFVHFFKIHVMDERVEGMEHVVVSVLREGGAKNQQVEYQQRFETKDGGMTWEEIAISCHYRG